jgi:[acyl-carrier-protein] S-malonyltransferase
MADKEYIFLFPGQGGQYPLMGIDFFDALGEVRELFAIAEGIMGRDMRSLLAGADAETLRRSEAAQIAITLVNLSAAAALKSRGVFPRACAGHSLGEYAALAVCGAISVEDALRLTARRGELMRDAAKESGGGMAAVTGLPSAEVEKAVREWTEGGLAGLYVANLNSPLQTVVSGTEAALSEAETRFREAGARRFIRLAVAGPFHSPLMAGAADRFSGALDEVKFADPAIPFFSNVTGRRVTSGGEAKTLALRQICAPVRWLDEEKAIALENRSAALEAGPGRALTGLWKDSGANTPCFPAGTLADIAKIRE